MTTVVRSIYERAATNKNRKYPAGNFVNPKTAALLVKVIAVKAIIPAKVVQITGTEGLLCTNGIFLVRRK